MEDREVLPLDIVEYSEDSMYSLYKRIEKYGIKRAFDTTLPVKMGVLVDIFGVRYVTDIHNKWFLVPYSSIKKRVTAIYRDNILIDTPLSYTILSGIMRIHSIISQNKRVELISLSKKMSKGFDSTMFITLLMFNCINIKGDSIKNTESLKEFIKNFGNYHKI